LIVQLLDDEVFVSNDNSGVGGLQAFLEAVLTYVRQADGQFSGNARKALLKVDGNYGGGLVGLIV
jgi:hypothetical protein